MSARRALITGASGQLGSDLTALMAGDWEVRALAHSELDVTDRQALANAFETARPDAVLNCAAFHNVEVCEREEAQALAVNVTAVKAMAELCSDAGTVLVHLSTNYVFDGRREKPYDEGDLPAPRSVYALSKLAGEHAALAYCERSLVVRSAGLYGLHGSQSKGGNFVTRMLDCAREQGRLRVVSDQRLTPTFTADLAAGLLAAIDSGTTGLLHMTSSGSCSWHEFTVAIMELAGVEVPVEAVATRIPAGGADRPPNGVLRSRVTGPQLRHWREALADYMERAGLTA